MVRRYGVRAVSALRDAREREKVAGMGEAYGGLTERGREREFYWTLRVRIAP